MSYLIAWIAMPIYFATTLGLLYCCSESLLYCCSERIHNHRNDTEYCNVKRTDSEFAEGFEMV